FLAPVTNGTLTKHFVTADGSIIIAGFFSEVAAQPRPGLARLFAAGPLDSSWVPAAPGLSQIMSLVPLPAGGFFVARFGFDPVTFQLEAQARPYTADGHHLDGVPFRRAGGFPDTWSAGPSGELVVTTMDPNFGVRNLVRVFDANGN